MRITVSIIALAVLTGPALGQQTKWPAAELEACIKETAELAAKSTKLRVLREVDELFDQIKRSAHLSNASQAGLGLRLLLQGPLIPLKAEAEADRTAFRVRADLQDKDLDTCRIERLMTQAEWLCPFPDIDDIVYDIRMKHRDECWQTWRKSLSAADNELLEAGIAKRKAELKH